MRPPASRFALSAAVLLLSRLCYCPRTPPPVTVRVPKRVLVRIERYADGGTAERGLAVLERHQTRLDDDERRGHAELEATVEYCDCGRRPADGRAARGGDRCTMARLNYGLSLYARDGATYFSATVDGDVVVENEAGTVVVSGEHFDRGRRATVFGPHRAGPDDDDDGDAIGDGELGEWLRREFSDRGDIGAAADGDALPDDLPRDYGGCVAVPPDRTAGYRGLLPGAHCLRAYSGERCEGESKMVFATAPRSLLPRDGNGDDSTAADPQEEPPFPVKSVTDCSGRKSRRTSGGGGGARVVTGGRPKCSCDCGSSTSLTAESMTGRKADVSTQTDPELITNTGPLASAVQKQDTIAEEGSSTDVTAGPEQVSAGSTTAGSKVDVWTRTDPELIAKTEPLNSVVHKDTVAEKGTFTDTTAKLVVVAAGTASDPLPAGSKVDVSTQTDPEPAIKTNPWTIVKQHLTAKERSDPPDVVATAKPAMELLIVATEPSSPGSRADVSTQTADRSEPLSQIIETEPLTALRDQDSDTLTDNTVAEAAAEPPADVSATEHRSQLQSAAVAATEEHSSRVRPAATETVPVRSTAGTERSTSDSNGTTWSTSAEKTGDDFPGGSRTGGKRQNDKTGTSFGEITTRIVEDTWRWLTMMAVAIGSFLKKSVTG